VGSKPPATRPSGGEAGSEGIDHPRDQVGCFAARPARTHDAHAGSSRSAWFVAADEPAALWVPCSARFTRKRSLGRGRGRQDVRFRLWNGPRPDLEATVPGTCRNTHLLNPRWTVRVRPCSRPSPPGPTFDEIFGLGRLDRARGFAAMPPILLLRGTRRNARETKAGRGTLAHVSFGRVARAGRRSSSGRRTGGNCRPRPGARSLPATRPRPLAMGRPSVSTASAPIPVGLLHHPDCRSGLPVVGANVGGATASATGQSALGLTHVFPRRGGRSRSSRCFEARPLPACRRLHPADSHPSPDCSPLQAPALGAETRPVSGRDGRSRLGQGSSVGRRPGRERFAASSS